MTRVFGKALFVPYTFVLMNLAAVAGLYHFVRGHPLGIWNSVAVRHHQEECRE